MNTQQSIHWMQNFNFVCCIPVKKKKSYVHDKFGSLARMTPKENLLIRDEFGKRLFSYIKKLLIDNSTITYSGIYKKCKQKSIIRMLNGKDMTEEGVRKYILLVKFELGLIDHKQGKPMSELTKNVIVLLNEGKTNSEIRQKLNLRSNHVAALRRFAFDRKFLNQAAAALFEQDQRKNRGEMRNGITQ